MSFPRSSTGSPSNNPAAAADAGAQGGAAAVEDDQPPTQSPKSSDSHSCTSAAPALPPLSESNGSTGSSNPIFKSVRSAWKKAKVRGRWRRSIDLEQARKERDQDNDSATGERTATHGEDKKII